MIPSEVLRKKLMVLDGKDYAAYQSLIGHYDYSEFTLIIDQIPKDPYAPPHTGLYRIQVPIDRAGITSDLFNTKTQKIALCDFLARQFYKSSSNLSSKRRGTGYSGIITIDKPSQSVLERSSIVINNDFVEVRCFIGLPGTGRKINAKLAEKMLFEEITEIIRSSLFSESINFGQLKKHIKVTEQSEQIRDELQSFGIVAFIADGAILPRESGTSDRPLGQESAVPFQSPDSLKIQIKLEDGETVKGMGIPKGVTLIAGGGYHGKSTLLKTIEQGIYNHITGDGREKCVSIPQTVKGRAYSGRYVEKTDISPFIRNLPFQKNTSEFSSGNSSGSTSQAATIIEAIEIGASLLLMDEDTCATNFMIRDRKMQHLVRKEDEPITTFIDKVRQLYTENGISTILVLGGVGDYFEVADQVIQMKYYVPEDVSSKAHEIAEASPEKRNQEDEDYPIRPQLRIPLKEGIDPNNEYGKKRLFATDPYHLHFGKQVIDLNDLEQLNEVSQTKAIGNAILYARHFMDGQKTLKEIVDRVLEDVDKYGLDRLSNRISGHFAQFRKFELAFAMNRLRSFKVERRQSKVKNHLPRSIRKAEYKK